jgi:peptide/nickel transport system permease protein
MRTTQRDRSPLATEKQRETGPGFAPPFPEDFGVSRRLPAGLVASIVVLCGLVVAAVFAPLIAPDNPLSQNLGHTMAAPSWSHLLGTDYYGRDVLSRLLWGGRSAFLGVLISLGVGLGLGVPWGLAAGYWPRWTGTVLMRIADTLLAFPALVLAVVITGILGPNLLTSMTSVGVVFAPVLARLTRVGVLDVRQREYVLSARMSGCSKRVILLRHVLPAALGPVVVQATIFAGIAFIIEGGLSFLGLGVQPPAPSWGGDLALAYQYILSSPGQVVAPGLLIAIVVLCVYRISDSLRARFDTQRLTDRAPKTAGIIS